jgi:hypothetical protein
MPSSTAGVRQQSECRGARRAGRFSGDRRACHPASARLSALRRYRIHGQQLSPPDARFPYGVLGWLGPRQDDGAPAFPLVSIVFDGTSQINDFTSRLMLGADKTFSMDDCGAIPGMLAATERFMATDEWRLQSTRINELFGSSGAGGPAKLSSHC